MREKIENRLLVTCDDVDLTTVSSVEFYVKQTMFFEIYKPTVLSENQMEITIPFDHAKRLRRGTVEMQFAFVDENGTPRASETIKQDVGVLLKEAGYDPI